MERQKYIQEYEKGLNELSKAFVKPTEKYSMTEEQKRLHKLHKNLQLRNTPKYNKLNDLKIAHDSEQYINNLKNKMGISSKELGAKPISEEQKNALVTHLSLKEKEGVKYDWDIPEECLKTALKNVNETVELFNRELSNRHDFRRFPNYGDDYIILENSKLSIILQRIVFTELGNVYFPLSYW